MKLKLYLILLVFSSQFLSHAQTGKSLNFDGINDGVILGTSLNSQLDPINNFTVEIMVRPESNSGTRYIVGNYKTASPDELQFLLRQENSYYQFWINDGPGFKLVSSPINTLQLNTWQHVTGVWDGSEIRIYIDGVLQNTTTGVTGASFVYTTNPVHIGQNTNNSSFDGDIDEIRIWSTVRSQAIIQAEMNTELVGNEPGLLRYYNFNQGIANGDNTAITNLIDASSNTNNGTFSNFTLTGTTSNFTGATNVSALSVPATHLNFDGVNDYVSANNNLLPFGNSSRTVEAWVKTSTSTVGTIVNYGNQSANQRFGVLLGGSGQVLVIGEFNDYTTTTSINDNNWHHVAVTFDGNLLTVYVDGVNVGTTNKTYATTGDLIGIGSTYRTTFWGELLDGEIDEVRIWNIARAQSDIQDNMNCELEGTESGLVSYYKFNQGNDASNNSTEIILLDSSSNGNNGTLNNFALNGATSNWLAGSPVVSGSIMPSNPGVTTPVVYNQGDTATPLTATVGANGTDLLWYTSATGGKGSTTAPTPSTSTFGNTSYWVSSVNTNGCESERVEIVVTVIASISGCWKNIYTGANQTYAIGNDGTLWSWGFNAEAQLGLGDASNRLVPTQIGTATNWKTLSSGDRHVLALREDGTLWVWGRNTQGHLGLGDTSQRNVPIQLGTATDWDIIDCGANTSLAIKTDGTLWVWGGNNEGQLGLGDLTQRLVPTQIGTDTDWIAINGAGQSTYAIKSNGTLWGTGANTDGQLGLGDNTQRLSFVQIGTDTNWSKVHVGFGAFALAQKVDGSLWGTGNNQFGQLGQNNTANLNLFTQVGTATDWNKFTTASSHSMAIKNDGTLYSWGRNNSGQLGLGDNSNRLVPTQVGSATNWYDVSGGDGFLLALNITGEIWSTGNNWAGQLGLGDTTNRNVLVQITCPSVLSNDDFLGQTKVIIYPNPSNGVFNILSQENNSIEVYDMIGKKILSKKLSIGSSDLDLSNYANGMYLINVTNENGNTNIYKLIKQ